MRLFSCITATFLILALLIAPVKAGGLFGGFDPGKYVKDRLQKEATNQITKQVTEAAGLSAPLHLDKNTAFPSVDAPTNFQPKTLHFSSAADLNRPLLPGDYAMPVVGYCTALGVPSPHQGLGAQIAPLQGRESKAVGALLVRGTMTDAPIHTLQVMVWRIEDGLPVSQWPSSDQDLVHKLIPEYEKELNGDSLQQVQSTYDKYAHVAKLPEFDTMLGQMGEAGQSFLRLKQARKLLADKSIADERLPQLLFAQAGSDTATVSDDNNLSPWAEIQPGIIARFTTLGGADHENHFEFRILPTAIKNAQAYNVPIGPRLQLAQAIIAAPVEYYPSFGSILYGLAPVAARAAVLAGEAVAVVVDAPIVAGATVIIGGTYIVYSISHSAEQPLVVMCQKEADSGENKSGKKSPLPDYMNDPNPETNPLSGKDPDDIVPGKLLPPDWETSPGREPGTTRYTPPGRNGPQILKEPGNPEGIPNPDDPTDLGDPIHKGPYIRISPGNGNPVYRIPLKGNPFLK